MKHKIFVTIALFSAVFYSHAEVLKIANAGAYPPWVHENEETGELTGYDIDVANKICELAKLQCEKYTQDFGTIIPSLRFKKYDMVIATMTDNPDRRRVVDFSLRYAKESSQFVTLKTRTKATQFCADCGKEIDISTGSTEQQLWDALLKTFKGGKIGVQKNSIAYKYFGSEAQFNEKIHLVAYKEIEDVMAGLIAGEVDCAIGDTSYFIALLKNEPELPVVRIGPEIIGKTFGKGIAVTIRKNQQELKKKINAAIKQLTDDGTLRALSLKWFEYDVSP